MITLFSALIPYLFVTINHTKIFKRMDVDKNILCKGNVFTSGGF